MRLMLVQLVSLHTWITAHCIKYDVTACVRACLLVQVLQAHEEASPVFLTCVCPATAATASLYHLACSLHAEVYQVNGAALLGEGCGGLLSGKLLLEDGSNQQVAGMFVVDSGCRGVELDLVLSKTKAESLGLRPYAGPGGQPVVLPGRAANRTPMPVVKMWPQVTMLVPLFRRGTGPVAALRKSNLTAWAADLDIVDYRRGGASEGGGATVNAIGDGEELWDEVASSSSSSVDETILTSHAEYDGTGYQALHSPITEDRHVALLGLSGLAKLGLMADFARNVVFSVRLQGVIASMHSI